MAGHRLEHDWWPQDVPENVRIGQGAWLYSSFAFTHHESRTRPSVEIGDHTGVYKGTMFVLGRDATVEVGAYCTLAGPIISTSASVTIADYALISFGVVIADGPYAAPPGSPTHVHDTAGSRDISIGRDCWIGAHAVILGGTTLGDGVVVGARSIVRGEVPAHSVVVGDTGRVLGRALPQPGPGP